MINEIRSLVHNHVRLMALTATATIKSRKEICHALGMKNPVVVSQSPNKSNITYSVLRKLNDMEATLGPLLEELQKERNLMDRTLIFCQKYDDVTGIYQYFVSLLGKDAVHPRHAPNLVKYRLVDMFTACTHPSVKQAILAAFTNQESPLRLLIATIAFGMGIDCRDIRRVIHWGPPNDVESYLQETGRAGRDNMSASAILYCGQHDHTHIDDDMKQYCSNTQRCRRELLLCHFDDTEKSVTETTNTSSITCICKCCDICHEKCTFNH